MKLLTPHDDEFEADDLTVVTLSPREYDEYSHWAEELSREMNYGVND